MEAVTRKEVFLAAAAGESIDLPRPVTREEQFLKKIAENAGSGSGANVTKLSDLENDLFYNKVTSIITLTQDKFTLLDGGYLSYAADGQCDLDAIDKVIVTRDGTLYEVASGDFDKQQLEGVGTAYAAVYDGYSGSVMWSNDIDLASVLTGNPATANVFNVLFSSSDMQEFSVEFISADTKHIPADVIDPRIPRTYDIDISGVSYPNLHTVITQDVMTEMKMKQREGYTIRFVEGEKVHNVLCLHIESSYCWFIVASANGIYCLRLQPGTSTTCRFALRYDDGRIYLPDASTLSGVFSIEVTSAQEVAVRNVTDTWS